MAIRRFLVSLFLPGLSAMVGERTRGAGISDALMALMRYVSKPECFVSSVVTETRHQSRGFLLPIELRQIIGDPVPLVLDRIVCGLQEADITG